MRAGRFALTYPCSPGAISASRRRAAEQFNAARETRINLARTTVTQARSLHMTVMSDVSRVMARKQSIVSSQSALDATQAGYEVGTRNIVDVLNAQNNLFAAQRDYANSRYDFIINSRLKEVAGTFTRGHRETGRLLLPPPHPPPPAASNHLRCGSTVSMSDPDRESVPTAPATPYGAFTDDEGRQLYEGRRVAPLGPIIEIGSYCGRSTIWLGQAALRHNTVLYAVDHHRGSEEHQPGRATTIPL